MNVSCKKDSGLERSYISINCHVTKLIINIDGKNILYDYDKYKDALEYIGRFIDKSKVSRVKDYISWNNKYVESLIKLEKDRKIKQKDNNQLSLF